jgi:SNF2 family DNA or RNA helicase
MSVQLSRPHKALIIPAELGSSVYDVEGVLPDGRQVLSHNIHNTLLLRNAGFAVPNPMEYQYAWPRPPFESQRRSAQLLVENARAYLLNEQGTGKTFTTLAAFDYLRGQGLVSKALVAGKLSTLEFVWGCEITRWFPHLRVQVLGSDKGIGRQERLKRLAAPADVYIINHDGVKVIADEIRARTDIDVLILDELAVYRNASDRSKGMRVLAERFKVVWGLTGAPMPNAPTDIWAQCKIITPHTVPKYFKACREALMTRVSQYAWRPRANAIEMAYGMMQPSIRYRLDEVVELPEIIERTIDVPLSEQQQAVYDTFRKQLAIMVEEKRVTAVNAGVLLNKLLQISGGYVYTHSPDFFTLDCAPRLHLVEDLVEANDQKVIVCAPYRHMVEGVCGFLNKNGIDACYIHGDVSDREKLFHAFQNTDTYRVMVAHPATIGHGITLTRANLLVWWSPIADFDVFDQANARIRRVGQEHKQQLLFLQSTAAERRVYDIVHRKEKVQDSFLSLIESITREQ